MAAGKSPRMAISRSMARARGRRRGLVKPLSVAGLTINSERRMNPGANEKGSRAGALSIRPCGRLFQRVRDVGEGQVEVAAHRRDGDYDCDRNARRDQAVFDGGGATLVVQKGSEKYHSFSPDGITAITRCASSNGKTLISAFRHHDDFPECRRPDGALRLEFEARRKKKGPGSTGAFLITNRPNAYFSALETLVKVVFSFEPTPWMTAMIATEMQA